MRRESLAPGTHVTSVGYNVEGREVDDATVVDSLVVVESRDAALAPLPAGSNDLLQPMERGLIGADHVRAEIGELVEGTKRGRSTSDQITLYKSVGVAVQDGAAAALVVRAARERGAGREVEVYRLRCKRRGPIVAVIPSGGMRPSGVPRHAASPSPSSARAKPAPGRRSQSPATAPAHTPPRSPPPR